VRVAEQQLREALTVRVRRRVRRDTTITVGGAVYEVPLGYLAGPTRHDRNESIRRQRAHPRTDNKRIALGTVDPVRNGKMRRPPRRPVPQPADHPVDFDPGKTLEANEEEDCDDRLF